jgi:hypothetical protein
MLVDKVADGSLFTGGAGGIAGGSGGAITVPSFSVLTSSMAMLGASTAAAAGSSHTHNSSSECNAVVASPLVPASAGNIGSLSQQQQEEEGEKDPAQTALWAYAQSLTDPESWPLGMKHCIGRVYHILGLGMSPVVVDHTETRGDGTRAAIHRASMIATVICNYCGRNNVVLDLKPVSSSTEVVAAASSGRRGRGSASSAINENWGPVLVVCRLSDMPQYEKALQLQCTAAFRLEVLSYYGSENDRTLLRSYIKGAGGGGGGASGKNDT